MLRKSLFLRIERDDWEGRGWEGAFTEQLRLLPELRKNASAP